MLSAFDRIVRDKGFVVHGLVYSGREHAPRRH